MKKIILKHTVVVDGQSINELKMRPPKVMDDLLKEKTEGGDLEKDCTMFANMCDVDVAVIYELHPQDHDQLVEAYTGFFAFRQKTSNKDAKA